MKKVTLIKGNGIGPEISESIVSILHAAQAQIVWDVQQVDEGVLTQEVLDSIKLNQVALKGPLMTPIGKGFRSLNVALRKEFELYANIRPVKNIGTIPTQFNHVDFVVFRENTEDLYAGIEHQIDEDTVHAIKIITRSASERIARAAYEYAYKHNKTKVAIVTKANIMKLADGLFLEAAKKIAKEYPTIKTSEILVDNMCMQLVIDPSRFDVIVTENLYGDILSDLGAGLIGGLGFVPSANIGQEVAIFEAVHGTAPDIVGKNIANPTALLLSACLLLDHIHQDDVAKKIRSALETLYSDPKTFTKDLNGPLDTVAYTKKMIQLVRDY